MSSIAVHPVTQRQLTAFREQPSHAVVLIGPAGSGKLTVAQQLAEGLLGLPPAGFTSYGYGLIIAPVDGKAIGIETVRAMEHFLSLKVPRSGEINRAVIIDAADKLTSEAQNALLKTLEEPPPGVLIILTAAHEQALLPTIRSRAMAINIRRPERTTLEAVFGSVPDFSQLYAISAGQPGLLAALVNDDEHPLKAATERARQLLSQAVFERLLAVDELAKQRQAVLDTLFILQNMAHISLQSANGPAAKRWQSILAAAYDAQTALEANAQPKLALTNLMLQL